MEAPSCGRYLQRRGPFFHDVPASGPAPAGAQTKPSARVGAARWRTVAGRAVASAGDGGLRPELQVSATEFEVCGGGRLRDDAERELRRLGRRFKRRTAKDGEGLAAVSARELEIAQLVSQRKTNREIAAQLFISEKTVETHLRHIFGKLGVSSRGAVARAQEGPPPEAASTA